jgi:hypothetical protein
MFEQDRVIVRLQQRVLGEAAILTCFLAGSYGRRTADAYSDLDVVLVFDGEEQRDSAYARRRDFAQSVLPYVPARSFDATHVKPYFHIALYSNGAKVDYSYDTRDSLQPNPWHRDIRLLKDTDGWGERYQAASAQLPPTITLAGITLEELVALDNRFWVMFWDVYRQLLRGDYDKPFPVYVQLLYFILPTFLQLLPPEDPAHQGLIQASFSQDTAATLAHLRRHFDAYLAARAAVIRRHHLAFTPQSQFESAIQRLVHK